MARGMPLLPGGAAPGARGEGRLSSIVPPPPPPGGRGASLTRVCAQLGLRASLCVSVVETESVRRCVLHKRSHNIHTSVHTITTQALTQPSGARRRSSIEPH